jgi:hypothetical protein
MFSNISNTFDMTLTEGFFGEYSKQSMSFTHTNIDPPFIGVPPVLQLDGLPVFLQFWYDRNLMVPDMCWRYGGFRIVSLRHSEES